MACAASSSKGAEHIKPDMACRTQQLLVAVQVRAICCCHTELPGRNLLKLHASPLSCRICQAGHATPGVARDLVCNTTATLNSSDICSTQQQQDRLQMGRQVVVCGRATIWSSHKPSQRLAAATFSLRMALKECQDQEANVFIACALLQHLLNEWESLSSAEQQELAAEIQASQAAAAAAAANHSSEAVKDVVPLQDGLQERLQDWQIHAALRSLCCLFLWSGAAFSHDVQAAAQQHATAHDCGSSSVRSAGEQQRAEWRQLGLRLIRQGKVGVLLLAGGQGTRLGSSAPKGCYDVGLPSHKSLFQLQAERLLAVQQLAAAAGDADSQPTPLAIPWFIMTSPFTHEETLQHFEHHRYFGLRPSQVTFFQQGFLPCLTPDGQVIMQTRSKIAKAPDGNGGLYRALQSSGALAKMQGLGLEALDVYCVDNILARLADPEYIGCCYSRRSQLGCRVLAKAYPEEKVGVFALDTRGGLQVLEYSELDPEKAAAVDPATGKLVYNWSNICMHYFALPWLQSAVQQLQQAAAYHIAHKQIPERGGGKVPGVKLEMFIFDPFCSAKDVTLFEVAREDHFAPVKNAPGSGADSPEAARAALLQQGARWVAAAGGSLAGGVQGVEVPAMLSYAGEGLQQLRDADGAD
ncbi:nucleotide-diphospho-sugar transferase [Scenedesmus sp. NREL 46B-D3]|nr:nucleotide-diphospho-sugar transferase [Scenedesmus sp. NREL 46B-D3]